MPEDLGTAQGVLAAPSATEAGGTLCLRERHYLGGAFVIEHRPAAGPLRGTAVVICPPLGYEDTCAHRPLRVLADRLAAEGHVVLRLDWPGLGDAAGDQDSPDLLGRSEEALQACAQWLRAGGARRVAGLAVRAGGLLALRSTAFDELALWGLPRSGRTYLREEGAFHKLAEQTFGVPPEDAVHPPEGAVEAGGFVYAPETVAALQALDAVKLAAGTPASRILLLERDGATPPPALLEAFAASGAQVSSPDAPGLSLLLKAAYESEISPAVTEALLAWLGVHGDEAPWNAMPRTTRLREDGAWVESPCLVEGGAGALAGVRCEPEGGAAPGATWILFFSAGGIRRCGPNRMWTRAARLLAAQGRPSLRIDVRDTGDSDGVSVPHADLEAMYSAASVDDAVRAYDWLKAQGAGEIDVVGLCSGSFLGAQLAALRQVRRAVLFNALVYVWNDEARGGGMENRLGSALSDGRQWKRLLSGQVDVARLARAVWTRGRGLLGRVFHRVAGRSPEDEVAALLRTGAERGARFHLVSSVGDPSIAYLERHVPAEVRPPLTLIPGADHTLRPAWVHPRVLQLLRDTL